MDANETQRGRAGRRTFLKTIGVGVAGAAFLGRATAWADAPPAGRPSPATPDEAFAALKAGNQRFAERKPQVRSTDEIEDIWTHILVGQAPFATVIGCADSRLAPELIFDQFFGDIFVVREAGNIAESPTNLGSLEYGQAVLGSKALLVLGHSSCGAVKAAFDNAKPGGNIDAVVAAIRPGIAGAKTIEDATIANVRAVIAYIRDKSPLLHAAESAGKIKIAGAVYTINTGVVTFL